MNTKEAMQLLLDGKRIRWEHDYRCYYIRLDENGRLVDQDGEGAKFDALTNYQEYIEPEWWEFHDWNYPILCVVSDSTDDVLKLTEWLCSNDDRCTVTLVKKRLDDGFQGVNFWKYAVPIKCNFEWLLG